MAPACVEALTRLIAQRSAPVLPSSPVLVTTNVVWAAAGAATVRADPNMAGKLQPG